MLQEKNELSNFIQAKKKKEKIDMKKSKWLCMYLCAILFFSTMHVEVFALNNSMMSPVKEIGNRIVTTVTVKDIKSGNIISYEAKNENITVFRSLDGKEVTVNLEIGNENKIITRSPSQSNSNSFYGWKGNVRISWYDDGEWACLKTAGGDWTRVSGSYNMTDKKINWGQDLGTNPRQGHATFINSYNTTTSWPKGKYGYGVGHKVGANISGTVNGQIVSISCNYVF